jgi:hypothetical protein
MEASCRIHQEVHRKPMMIADYFGASNIEGPRACSITYLSQLSRYAPSVAVVFADTSIPAYLEARSEYIFS